MARLRKKSRNQPEADQETVALNDADHAWWAQGRVNHVPTSATEAADRPDDGEPTFFDEWSAESLYRAEVTPDDVDAPDDDSPPLFAVDEAYLILGVTEDATWDDVVVAHRRLAKRYHPDRLIDASPEAQERGEARMRELNVAYESLRRAFHPPTRTLFTA